MRNRFTEEQIIGILKMQANGKPTKDIFRQHNITEKTFIAGNQNMATWKVAMPNV